MLGKIRVDARGVLRLEFPKFHRSSLNLRLPPGVFRFSARPIRPPLTSPAKPKAHVQRVGSARHGSRPRGAFQQLVAQCHRAKRHRQVLGLGIDPPGPLFCLSTQTTMFALGDLIIDVYHREGDLDWRKVAAGGIKGAFLKASQGLTSYVPWLERNCDRARSAGLEVGAYFFVDPDVDAVRQVDAFWDATDSRDFPLGMAIDVEWCYKNGSDAWQHLKGDAASAYVRSLIDNVRAWGFESPWVYTNTGWWNKTVCRPASADEDIERIGTLKGCRSWVARYGKAAPVQPESFSGDKPHLWQFTESGLVAGVGKYDLSRVVNPWE